MSGTTDSLSLISISLSEANSFPNVVTLQLSAALQTLFEVMALY